MGAIMYTLANIDFSNRFGVVVGELPPEEQDQSLDTKQGAALSDLAAASLPARELETAVFGAP